MTQPVIKTQIFDFGARIGIAVEYDGKRRAVRIDNPFWPEMEAEWNTVPRRDDVEGAADPRAFKCRRLYGR